MFIASWNNVELARSSATIEIEGNQYFPPEDVNTDYLEATDYHTKCPWKGLASYYSIKVDGKVNENAAWYYPEPLEKAKHIAGYIAFWKGVTVEEI
ncbi:DUF427 domain-containing protein [Clostridia bacterium]|nr:DUF427 domain-containing protein [Clostridia bacterium]